MSRDLLQYHETDSQASLRGEGDRSGHLEDPRRRRSQAGEKDEHLERGHAGESAQDFARFHLETQLPVQDADQSGFLLLLAGFGAIIYRDVSDPQGIHLQQGGRSVPAAASSAPVHTISSPFILRDSRFHYGAGLPPHSGYLREPSSFNHQASETNF